MNKECMSDTPRTNKAAVSYDGQNFIPNELGSWVHVTFAREFERELNETREMLNDWCDTYGGSPELTDLKRENARLEAWKREAIAVERSWNVQEVGRLLGLTLGQDIRAHIEPKIRALQAENARLREALEDARGCIIAEYGSERWWTTNFPKGASALEGGEQ